MVPDGSIARETLFIRLTNGRSIFGRPRLARRYRLFCVDPRCRGVVTAAPVPRVSALCDPGHRKHTLNTQLENTVGRTSRILYGQHRNSRRNTTCIPAPWTWSASPNRRLSFTINRGARSISPLGGNGQDEACISSLSLVYHPLRGIKVQGIN